MKNLPDIIEIDIEASDKDCAFFALYAGLRMYMDYKNKSVLPGVVNIAAAEAYCMLRDLEEKYPVQYQEAKEEYDTAVAPNILSDR